MRILAQRFKNNHNFYFENDEIAAEYRTYARDLFTFPSVIPISIYYTLFVICNYNIFASEQYINKIILLLIFLGYILFFIFLYCEAVKRIFEQNSNSVFLKLSEWIELSSFGKQKENMISVVYSVVAGLVLFARVDNGNCDHVKTFWELQSCNPGAKCGMIPPNQVIVCYATPVLAQLSLRAVSYPHSLVSWAITVLFVLASILKVGSWEDIWLLSSSFIFLHIICEFERGFRSTFRLSKETVDMYRKQEKLQHDLNIAALEKERTLHEKAVVEVQCQKDKELSETIGIQLRSLIGNVAHDLKTPLQAIGLGVEEIRERACQIRQNQICDEVEFILDATTTISATVAFMSMTINRAIDFTKASQEIRLVPTFETIDLEQALAWPVRIMSALQRRIGVVVDPLPPTINRFIISDKGWLTENLLCLISNAIKYSNEGSICIRCSLAELALTGSASSPKLSESSVAGTAGAPMAARKGQQVMFQVEVEDAGIGISSEMQTRLFTSFQQAQRMAGGTGLGLYSMSKRMEALRGQCGVRSRLDGLQGSCFWFRFPYRPDPLAAAHCAPTSASSTPTSSPASSASAVAAGDLFPSNHSLDSCALAPTTFTSFPSTSTSSLIHSTNTATTTNLTIPIPPTTSTSSSTTSKGGSSLASPCQASRPPPMSSSGSVRSNKPCAPGSKGCILVVDDSMPILKMTSLSLSREGFSVTTAVNGSEALKHLLPPPTATADPSCTSSSSLSTTSPSPLSPPPATPPQAGPFSLVLMDLQMPVMDGLEAVRRLRAFEAAQAAAGRQWSRLPVIAMSANDDEATTSIVLSSGFDHFIPKPFSLERFREACAAVLR